MKKVLTFFIGIMLVFSSYTKADEGMWLLNLLNKSYDDMKKQGMKLTPEDIYNLNKPSLKDAICQFGGGCTGEIVSGEGLLFTNHHCGYGSIQKHSSVEHDYLKDGFWAKAKDQELPCEGLTARFLVRIEDVTNQVLKNVSDTLPELKSLDAIRKAAMDIAENAKKGNNYEAFVRPFFGGNTYYLMVFEVYRDVRFVGAPPSSIGKFGGDTDNWMWPRHTGDFSVFRVYMSKDGKPAGYSTENVPMKPKHFLPISIKGVKPGDFTMIVGFPGRTQRYATSYEVDEIINVSDPIRVKIRGIRQDIMLADMLADDKVRIQYSSKYAGSSNYWKKSMAEIEALSRLKVVDQKAAQEADFMNWVNANDQRKAKYGNALSLISDAVKARKELLTVSSYYGECFRGIEIYNVAGMTSTLAGLLSSATPDQEKIKAECAKLKENIKGFYKDYNAPTDQKVTAAMLRLVNDDLEKEFYPSFMVELKAKYGKNFEKYAADLFAKSMFVSQEKVNAFLENPTKDALLKDPAYIAITSVSEKSRNYAQTLMKFNGDISKGQRLYIGGLLEKNPQKAFYPDANSTIRLTYGKVMNYRPKDGVLYEHYTTLKGVMQKENPDSWEFEVPAKLKELYQNKDYGQYAQNGELVTCFLSNNDITGGNSGSPIMNAKGELLGLAFDGNSEAMSSDIAFEPELQRTINVDIRYVLFIIDKFGGASNLISELKIVK